MTFEDQLLLRLLFVVSRNGGPGFFLCDFCLPPKWCNDESLFPLWNISEVEVIFMNLIWVSAYTAHSMSIFSVSFSGSRLGGIVTVLCFFFNHGEVRNEILSFSPQSCCLRSSNAVGWEKNENISYNQKANCQIMLIHERKLSYGFTIQSKLCQIFLFFDSTKQP